MRPSGAVLHSLTWVKEGNQGEKDAFCVCVGRRESVCAGVQEPELRSGVAH